MIGREFTNLLSAQTFSIFGLLNELQWILKEKIAQKNLQKYMKTAQNASLQSEEMHPVLLKLLEKSIVQADKGEFLTTEEVMKRAKEKFPFLK